MGWLDSSLIKIFMLIIYLIISPITFASDTGTALKNDTLKASPFNDAKSNGKLYKNEDVEILNKKGAWLQIKTKSSAGWVRLLSVKRRNSNTVSTSSMTKVANGRIGSGKIVSTTGIRGLSAESLGNASFNDSEIMQLESYQTDAVTASSYAKAGQLSANKMAYLKGK